MKRFTLALIFVALFVVHGSAAPYYWDSDADATGNITDGTNLGGTGDWNIANLNWWDGSAATDVAWVPSSTAIFTGAGGFVTIPQGNATGALNTRVANGITFLSHGYELTATGAGTTSTTTARGTLSLVSPGAGAAPNITIDSGVSATIRARLIGTAGYNVIGGGTIILNEPANLNGVTGPVNVSGASVLELAIGGQIGGTGVGAGTITLDDGTLRNQDLGVGGTFLTVNRSVAVGNGGGTIDLPASAQILLYSGTLIAAPGSTSSTLTKVGLGEIRMSGTATQINTIKKVVIKEGLFTLGQAANLAQDRMLGAEPGDVASGLDAVTVDGGTLRFVGGSEITLLTTHANRGFFFTASGGTLRNDGTNVIIPGKLSGDGGFTKIGGLVFTLSGTDNTYAGITNINQGELRVSNTLSTHNSVGPNTVSVGTTPTSQGTLGGTGYINSPIDVTSGGHITADTINPTNGSLVRGTGTAVLNVTNTLNIQAGGFIETYIGATTADKIHVTTDTNLTVAAGGILSINPVGNIPIGNAPIAPPTEPLKDVFVPVVTYTGDISSQYANLVFNNATGYDVVVQNNTGTSAIEVKVLSTVQDKQWAADVDGNWSIADTASWTSPGQPNGPGSKARFLDIITVPRTVTIQDTSKTVGELVLNSALDSVGGTVSAYTLNTHNSSISRLLFNTYSGIAKLTVADGSHTINSPMSFIAPTEITVPTGETLFTTDSVSVGGGVTITGGGTVSIFDNDWIQLSLVAGGTTITDGRILYATSAAGLGNTSQITIGTLGTLDMNNFNDTVGSLVGPGPIINSGNMAVTGNNTSEAIYNGSFTGTNTSRTFTKNGTGVQTLGGTNSFTSATPATVAAVLLNAGRLNVTNSSALGTGIIAIANAASTELTSSAPGIVLTNNITVLNANTKMYALGAADGLTLNGIISGAGGVQVNTGAGTLTVNGVNTFTGGLKAYSRGLVIGNKAALGTGTFTIGDSASAPALPIALTAGIVLNGANAIANAVTVNRDFTVEGTNELQLSGAVALGTTVKTITVAQLTGQATLSGVVGGALGGITKVGPGTLVLSGANTYTGGTIVDAGTLSVTGATAKLGTTNVTVNGTTAGTSLSIATGVTNAITDTATLSLLGGGTGGTPDQGFATLNTGINEKVAALLLGGVAQFTGITYGSTASAALIQSNEYFAATSGIVTVGLLGDFNNNNSVDAADYVVWRKNEIALGGAAGYNLWRANFGNTAPGSGSGTLGGGAVPEPSTLGLLVLGLSAAFVQRRRHARRS